MENYTFDLMRIFFGGYPPLFVLEMVLRTVVIFTYSLLLLRFFSGRGSGVTQLTLFEVVLIVLIGSAVGDPIMYPDVSLMQGIVTITLVVFLQRVIIKFTNSSRRIEQVLEGQPIRLVCDGMIDIDGIHNARLSFTEVQMELRHQEIENLGLVRRAYLETDGNISIFQLDDSNPHLGLNILPDTFTEDDVLKVGTAARAHGTLACQQCGNLSEGRAGETLAPCGRCEGKRWVPAYQSAKAEH